jgi:glycosyltransferase involved in cell wall biosynthesis
MHISVICLSAADFFIPGGGRSAGGTERQGVLVARGLARRGHRVTCVVRDEPGLADPVLALAPFRSRPGLPRGIGRIADVLRLRRAAGRPAPDVFLTLGAGRQAVDVSLLAAVTGRPFLFRSVSDDDFLWKTTHRGAWARWLFRRAVRRADAVIAQTERQRSLARAFAGVEATVVPNAVELPAEAPPPGDEVLWVGMLRPEKRPERVLALARVLPRTRFTVVGGVPAPGLPGAEAAQAFLREAATLPNVACAGYQPHDSVMPFFDRAAVVINTSPGEGFPNVFLEAWARGRPVLTEGVDPDGVIARHGLGVCADGPEAMAETLGRLLDDAAWRHELGANARRYVAKAHALAPVLDQYEALLRAAVSR